MCWLPGVLAPSHLPNSGLGQCDWCAFELVGYLSTVKLNLHRQLINVDQFLTGFSAMLTLPDEISHLSQFRFGCLLCLQEAGHHGH